MYKLILKPLFFLFSPERAHYLAMDLLQAVCAVPGAKAILRRMYRPSSACREVQIAGLTFPNVVGLAAGFDKDSRWVDALECLGFGFIEIGTVTPLAQPGNDKPRLFRLPQDEALINRMGFNNGGAAAAAQRLRKRYGRVIIGGNIGKNKTTPNEQATDDYVKCFHALRDTVDYFVVNVSSPNTPGLRELQDKAPLLALLRTLQQLNTQSGIFRPIFLKIAPDLTESQLDDIISIIEESAIAGIIATNTTVSREGLHTSGEEVSAIGAGGLSGKPIRERSTEVVRYICQKSQGKIPVIAVGGIANGKDAEEKLNAGASLVQVYTGFIYEGPSIVKRILNYLNQSG